MMHSHPTSYKRCSTSFSNPGCLLQSYRLYLCHCGTLLQPNLENSLVESFSILLYQEISKSCKRLPSVWSNIQQLQGAMHPQPLIGSEALKHYRIVTRTSSRRKPYRKWCTSSRSVRLRLTAYCSSTRGLEGPRGLSTHKPVYRTPTKPRRILRRS